MNKPAIIFYCSEYRCTGPSVIVSPRGVVKERTDFYQRGYVSGMVEYIKEKSVFTLYGYILPIICSVVVVILFILFVVQLQNHAIKNQKEIFQLKKLNIHYISFGFLYAVFLFTLIISSISTTYRMTPDAQLSSFSEALNEFFEPLDKLAPDKVGDKFLQTSSNTCGPAVLAYLFSYFGHEVVESELVATMNISEKGSTMLELKKIAVKNGFQAKGVLESYAALMQEPLPVIAYINDSHYVVVNKITSSSVYLFDPLLGHIQVKREVFERAWKGYVLLISVNKIKDTI